ncbi:unnamed protein product, partial [Mesorhabditis belari]|uniref:Major facilitator superfamily (MFS) profile domain-containing protein n=1 Tax=Mesorhabditis belari TaxID=2138241 RepID=A0AAF3J9G8_9BILA
MGIINPMNQILQEYLATSLSKKYGFSLEKTEISWIWSSTAGMLFIGAALGALGSSAIISRKGPVKALLYSAIWLLISAPLCGISSFIEIPEFFILGRFCSGIGIGIGMTAHGIFLIEISSVKFRGIISSFGGFSINIGFIFANFLGLPVILGTQTQWPIAFLIEGIPNILLILGIISFFHETPIHLLRFGKDQAAKESLKVYSKESDVDQEIEKLKRVLKFQQKTDKWSEILVDGASRSALLFSCALNCVVAFSGITAVSFFGTFLLESIGFSSSQAALANLLSGFAGTLGAIFGSFGLDRVGRRFLVIGSLLLLAFINTSMMILVALFNQTQNKQIAYGFLLLFVMFLFTFSAGVGPTAWFLGAELSPASSRAKIQSASVFCQYIFCFISPLIYYPLSVYSPTLSFLLFIVPLTVSAVYFYRYLPETKGKTFEEIFRNFSK